jgi:TldD protein
MERLFFQEKWKIISIVSLHVSSMMDKIQEIMNDISFSKGEFMDIRFYKGTGTLISLHNGRPSKIHCGDEIGVGIRSLIDGGWGFVSIVGNDKNRIEKAAIKARKIARATSKKVKEKGMIPEEFVFEGTHNVSLEIDPRDITLETKYNVIESLEKVTRTYSDRIVSTSASFKEWFQTECIVNNLGTAVQVEKNSLNLACMATARKGDLMQNVYLAHGSSNGWEDIKNYDIITKGEDLAKRAIKLLNAEKPPSGKRDIIMGPSLVGVYIHESLGHAEEADSILAKESILEGKMNQKIGSEQINVFDDPTIKGLRGSYSYDSEGTKTQKRQLVKNGRQINYLHSLETAAKMGVKPNGAGRAVDFHFRPIVRMGNTYLDAGEYSFEELLEEVKNGVYLEHSYGGYVDTAKGEFYFSAQGGNIIRNGELAEPIQNVSMSGLCLEVLQRTIAVGDKLEFAFPGSCGKFSQRIPVHAGGPPIAVKDIVVGGST